MPSVTVRWPSQHKLRSACSVLLLLHVKHMRLTISVSSTNVQRRCGWQCYRGELTCALLPRNLTPIKFRQALKRSQACVIDQINKNAHPVNPPCTSMIVFLGLCYSALRLLARRACEWCGAYGQSNDLSTPAPPYILAKALG